MDWLQFFSSIVASLAWPMVVLAFVLLFRQPIAELIGRLRTVKALGVEASVALAESAATATVQAAQAQAVIEATTSVEQANLPTVTYAVPDNTYARTDRRPQCELGLLT